VSVDSQRGGNVAVAEHLLHRLKIGRQLTPGYNVQTAVDVEHALIVAHKVTTDANDQRMLLPMTEAAKQAVGSPNPTTRADVSRAMKSRCEKRPWQVRQGRITSWKQRSKWKTEFTLSING
jgi:hypothetical protein